MAKPDRVLSILQFARLINRNDFIDTIIRWGDRRRFKMMACTLSPDSNIEPLDYRGHFPEFSLGVTGRLGYPNAILRLAHLIRTYQVDILHAHHFEEALIGAAAVRLAGRCQMVVGRHYHDEIYLLTRGVKRAALLRAEALVNREARKVIVPSGVIRQLMLEHQKVAADKVAVIPYGFDFAVEKYRHPAPEAGLSLRREFGLGDGLLVGNFGRHHVLKGQAYLLQAFARFLATCPTATLLMVGDGPNHESLKHLAGQLGLLNPGRAVFTGWRKDAWRMLEGVDAVIHPTLHEALPQLMVEAMSKARPLAITDVSGACDHVRHLDNAFLLKKRDQESILDALRWMHRHHQSAQDMGARARRYVMSELPVQKIIPQFEALYEEVAWRSAA